MRTSYSVFSIVALQQPNVDFLKKHVLFPARPSPNFGCWHHKAWSPSAPNSQCPHVNLQPDKDHKNIQKHPTKILLRTTKRPEYSEYQWTSMNQSGSKMHEALLAQYVQNVKMAQDDASTSASQTISSTEMSCKVLWVFLESWRMGNDGSKFREW